MHQNPRLLISALLLTAATVTLPSCASKTGTGAAVGAVGGAVIGGGIGAAAGSTTKGVIIGAVVGGAAGAIIGHQMDKQAKEIKQNIPGAKVERVGEGILVTFDSGLLFDFDSDALRAETRSNLRKLAQSLDKYPGTDLMVAGHTDQIGSQAYNQGLSERRARSAGNYLVSQGVVSSRIQSKGLGETEPVGPNDTEAGRQANRRVEVAIYAGKEMREKAGGR
jgi:outer membrane protein OmpA-like peptidoglycan-associated protein